MDERTCTVEECDKKHRARGLCVTHYNQQLPARHAKTMVPCDWCGEFVEKYVSRTVTKRFCSFSCRDQWAADMRVGCHNPNRAKPMTAKRAAREKRETRRRILADLDAGRYARAVLNSRPIHRHRTGLLVLAHHH